MANIVRMPSFPPVRPVDFLAAAIDDGPVAEPAKKAPLDWVVVLVCVVAGLCFALLAGVWFAEDRTFREKIFGWLW